MYEGKAKKIYQVDSGNEVILEYKNSLTAGDGAKKGSFEGKGIINANITSIIFEFLKNQGIDTHFVRQISETELLCKKVNIIPLEIVVRNVVAGSFSRRYGFQEGTKLNCPIVELFLKNDELHDPLLSDLVAIELGYITAEQLSYIRTIALQINYLLKSFFLKLNLDLIDFKLEFGIDEEQIIILADEITQDTIRVWDTKTGEKKDKDRFRRDLGNVQETYEKMLSDLKTISTEFSKIIALKTCVELRIHLKNEIIDSTGEITKRSLEKLGYEYILGVRSGKNLILELNGVLNAQKLNDLKSMTEKLLSNPLIEKTEFLFSFSEQ
jgi:phosphoribosylaminoimidazole-succinocarboxamide synthase